MRPLRICLAILLLAPLVAWPAVEFHVSTTGSDDGDLTGDRALSGGKAGSSDHPFATIRRARDAIRQLKRQGAPAEPIEVVIHGGTYFLAETMRLSPVDSGTAEAPIIYRAVDGEHVVLSGGERIPGPWTKQDGSIWSAALPGSDHDWNFRQLFVNGQREIRARYPNVDAEPSYLFGGGNQKDAITIKKGVIKPCWGTASDAQVHIVPEWRYFNQLQTITGVDLARSILRLGTQEQHARIIDGSWFYLEGIREELDQAREWFLDTSARRLFYWPANGVDPNHLDIIAPRLNQIVHLQGDVNAGTHVEYVTLRGLEFRHSNYTLGHIEARVNTDAAVLLENASHCRIERCHFANIGGYGIWLHLDSCDNTIDGNTITDAGCGGVLLTAARFSYLDDSKLFTPGTAAENVAPLRNEITRNHIHHCGLIRLYNSGVHIDSRPAVTALAAGNRVANNYIHDMPRCGIFLFRNQGGNIIEFNRIENIMLATEDGGGIHLATMNQIAAPNLIANNLITDAWGWRQLPNGGRERHIARGIYLDWYTSSTRIENNITYNTLSGGLQFNAGDDNEFVNNIIVGDKTRWDVKWGGAQAQGTVDQRNLVIPEKTKPTPLRNPANGDFTLAKDFPTYPAGFSWIDVSQIGLDGTARSGMQLSAMARDGGVLNWDAPQGVEIHGPWEKRTADGLLSLYQYPYQQAKPKAAATMTFALPIREAGLYTLRLYFPADKSQAAKARVIITHAAGTATALIDQRTFGFGPILGRYRFAPNQPARVTISAADADGRVAIEGVGFVRERP
jgi:parallel beta-helix repeat protein